MPSDAAGPVADTRDADGDVGLGRAGGEQRRPAASSESLEELHAMSPAMGGRNCRVIGRRVAGGFTQRLVRRRAPRRGRRRTGRRRSAPCRRGVSAPLGLQPGEHPVDHAEQQHRQRLVAAAACASSGRAARWRRRRRRPRARSPPSTRLRSAWLEEPHVLGQHAVVVPARRRIRATKRVDQRAQRAAPVPGRSGLHLGRPAPRAASRGLRRSRTAAAYLSLT